MIECIPNQIFYSQVFKSRLLRVNYIFLSYFVVI